MSRAEDFGRTEMRFDTIGAFLDWAERQPERWELVGGVARLRPRAMTGGSRNHALVCLNAASALLGLLPDGPCTAFGTEMGVVVDGGDLRYPDASISCEPPGDGEALHAPVVIVEVLSPSTQGYDIGDKAAAYRRLPSLRHLLLVRQDRIAVAHYHRAAAGDDFTLTDVDRIDVDLPLAAVDVALPVAALYARVRFAG